MKFGRYLIPHKRIHRMRQKGGKQGERRFRKALHGRPACSFFFSFLISPYSFFSAVKEKAAWLPGVGSGVNENEDHEINPLWNEDKTNSLITCGLVLQ